MILSHWLATLLGGALAAQGALAIELNVDDPSRCPAFQHFPCGLPS